MRDRSVDGNGNVDLVKNTPLARLLECKDLRKSFGRHVLFEKLSFSFGAGAVALVAPNGRGKSTLVSILCGVTEPDSGSVAIAGHDLATDPIKAKACLAMVPDAPVAYPFMTGLEFLSFVRAFRHIDGTCGDELIGLFQLESAMDRKFADMSLGTRRKFTLVSGLIGNAPVVVMDEPTNGLDDAARNLLYDVINRSKNKQLFLFATHDTALVEGTNAQVLTFGP